MRPVSIFIVIISVSILLYFSSIKREGYDNRNRGFIRIGGGRGGGGGDNRFNSRGVGTSTTVYDVNPFAYSQNEFCSLNPGSSLCH